MFKRLLSATLAATLALAFVLPVLRAEEPPNLQPHKTQLRAYVASGNYAKDVAEVALAANKYLVKRIAKGAKPGQKLAVVFDIDETTLSNLSHIQANDFGYVPRLWDEWVALGRAPAIVPVQVVYDTAVRGKIDVFFITARKEADHAGTERNLVDVGYGTWTKIFYKPADFKESTKTFKIGIRRQLTQEGYVIVANIGDQVSDLIGGYAEKYFKLPNPFYTTD